MSDPTLRLAIQKKGRLHDDSYRLLKECGIKIINGDGRLRSVASNFPLEVYFLRDDDIPQYVADGVADCAADAELIVNCTSLGMSPNLEGLPWDEDVEFHEGQTRSRRA